jgi:hypothetical protein
MNNHEKAVEEWLLNKIKKAPLSLKDILILYKEDGFCQVKFDSTDMKFLIFRLVREKKAKLDDNLKLQSNYKY